MSPPESVPQGQPWIVSRRFDVTFFCASLAVPLLLWVGFSAGWLTGVAVYVLFQVLFNLPHNFQTWTLSVLDPADRARNGRRYVIASAICLSVIGGPMVLSPDVVYPLVRDALIYWGYYHLVRQHYGFQRLYERKSGGVGPRESFFFGRLLDAVSYLPLLLRFDDASNMTIRAGANALAITHVPLSRAAWFCVLALWGLAVLLSVGQHIVLASRGRTHLWPRTLLLWSVTVCFGLAGLVIDDLIVAIAVVTAYHNLQYLGLLGFHNANRARLEPGSANPTIRWLQDGRWRLYVAASLIYGLVVLLPRASLPGVRLAELPITFVVAMHYYVDSRMWRFADYPERGRWLGLSRPARVESAGSVPGVASAG